jgi:Protein of unknown function (DUF3071)
MQELRFVAVSEDGSYAVLAVPGRSGRYVLPIDERLRAVSLGQTSRLAQYEIEVESPLRPKEIQARIRAGETAEEIADAAGIPVERVRWFEGPVLAERAYIAQQAQTGSVRRAGDSTGPGPRLGDVVTARLSAAGTDPDDGQWDSRKRGDGNWQVSLTFPSAGRVHIAEWVFDPRRRHVMPDDDNAARLSLPESELPPEPVALPGEATVTPIASRLGAAAGMGGGVGGVGGGGVSGYAGAPGGSRFRPERSVIPDRSLGSERGLADRPHGDWSQAERPAGYQSRQGPPQPGYAEFPESAPYRGPEHRAPEHRAPEHRATEHRAAEPGYRAPAAEPGGYRTPAVPPGPPAVPPSAYRDPEPAPASFRPAEAGDSTEDDAPRAYRQPVTRRASDTQPADTQPAYTQPAGYRDPEPADHRAPARDFPPEVPPPAPASGPDSGRPAPDGPAFDDSERMLLTPPRHVVFEEPEPALLGEQLEPTDDTAPATSAPTPSAATPAPAAAPAVPSPASEPARHDEPAARQPARHDEPAAQAVATAQAAAPARPAEPVSAPQPAAAPEETPAEKAATATPSTPVTASSEPAAPVAPEPKAEVPVSTAADPAAPASQAEIPAPAESPAAEEQANRPRPGAKKNAKARRSSVPSWDEIMLGSSRQRE